MNAFVSYFKIFFILLNFNKHSIHIAQFKTVTLVSSFLLLIFFFLFSGGHNVLFAGSPCSTNKPISEWSDCHGSYTFTTGENEGSKYTGDFKNGRYHGHGEFVFKTGTKYIGRFESGKYHGYGVQKFSNGEEYIGNFNKNKFDGIGTFSFKSGDKYVGEFKNNKRNGYGTYTFSNGDEYVGEFKDDKYDGKGRFTFADGRVREGYFAKNIFLGEDREQEKTNPKKDINTASECIGRYSKKTWTNCFGKYNFEGEKNKGDIYVGHFKNGMFHGDGVYKYKDGTEYEGKFRNNIRSGFGIMTFSNGDRYEGEWENDKQNGFGFYRYKSGATYVGNNKDNKSHGHGIFTYTNGSKYSGEYSLGKKEGHGTLSFSNGDYYVGEFKNNKKQGLGTYTYADGEQYTGEFKNDMYDGKGVLSRTDGTSLDGVWKKNKFIHANGGDRRKKEVAKKTDLEKSVPLPVASGTGFYVSEYGHLVTNNHVVQGCNEIKIHFGESILLPKKIAFDQINDLAILKTENNPKHVFSLSKENPYPLQEILVAGFPFGYGVSRTIKYTQGIVSSMAGIGNNYSQLQIDAAIQPGNSGGPILDAGGNVIGVAVSKLELKKILKNFGVIPENTNFGIKASILKNLLEGNDVPFKENDTRTISRRELSKKIKSGTVLISCWMTEEQMEKYNTKKMFFGDFKLSDQE